VGGGGVVRAAGLRCDGCMSFVGTGGNIPAWTNLDCFSEAGFLCSGFYFQRIESY
jgi:hypothetical protein